MGRHAADQGPHLGALMTDETDETGPFGGSVDSASLYDAGQLARIAYLNFMCGNNPQPTSYQPAAKCAYCSLVAGIAAGIRSQSELTLSGSWELATSLLGLERWGFVVPLYINFSLPP